MVELLLIPGKGRCLRRVKRKPIVNRPGCINRWPDQPKHILIKSPSVAGAPQRRSPREILAEIAALDAEAAEVLARIGGLMG